MLAVMGLVIGLSVMPGASSAHAQGIAHIQGIPANPPVCDGGASPYCLNDWNGGGSGNPVKMYGYETNLYNEQFSIVQLLDRCGGVVSDSCPFTNSTLDKDLVADGGGTVDEVLDTTNGLCLSTNTSGTAVLGACPTDGSGGAPGNIFVYTNYGFSYGGEQLISNYWTNKEDTFKCTYGNNQNGASIDLDNPISVDGCTAWNPISTS
jgi:hypothetical protein